MTRCERCQRRLSPRGECPLHGHPTAIIEVVDAPSLALEPPPGWDVVQPLALGGTAAVHLVRRPNGATAVLKWARWHDPVLRARFELEAEVLRAVGPPATPALVERGDIDDRPYLVMEHVEGETLAAWIARGGDRASVSEALAILIRLAQALHRIHARGYVHRDVKPENAIVGPSGVRVLDLGLAKPLRASGAALTQLGSVVGTLHYLAPEQIRGGDLDHRADLYSFGVIAFEMLTGRPPFVGERRAIEYQHLACRPPSLREARELAREVDDLVRECMAKQPAARPASAEEVAARLSRLYESLGTVRALGYETPVPALGSTEPIALAWLDGDLVAAARAVADARGMVAHRRGGAVVAAFTNTQFEAPVIAAIDACRAFARGRCRAVVHSTTALVRRSEHGRATVYGDDVAHVERWLPSATFVGMLLTTSAAEHAAEHAEPADDVPGWFRERDHVSANGVPGAPKLVGRDRVVRDVVAAVLDASALLVGIAGRPGVGKSRVLDAIASQLRGARREVVALRGRRRLLGAQPDDDRLIEAIGGGADVADALARAGAAGTVVVVDDAHLLSARALRALVDPTAAAIRVVASPGPLFEAITDTPTAAFELGPLDDASCAALVRELLRPARLVPDVLVERLAAIAEREPGALVEIARELKHRGAVRCHPGGDEWYVAVDALDELHAIDPPWLAARMLERLPGELADTLSGCAALGPRFRADEAAAVLAAPDAAERLAVLVRDGVIGERGGWYEFVDARVQDAIYDHALAERAQLHERALSYWLAQRKTNVVDWLARVAHHAAGAHRGDLAATCWLGLADVQRRRGELDEADELAAHASAQLERAAPPRVAEALALLRGDN